MSDENEFYPIVHGDSFDIGQETDIVANQHPQGMGNPLANINPNQIAGMDTSQLAQILNVNHNQAKNVKSLFVGGGTGATYNALVDVFGSEVAGGLAGLLSGYLARKIMGGS